MQETTELVDGWEENGQNGDGSLKSKSMVTWGRGEAGGRRERGRLTSSDESAKREHFGTLVDRVYFTSAN